MRPVLKSMAILAATAVAFAPAPGFTTCAEPDYLPFQGDVKIACAIDWRDAGENDTALFAPLGGDYWAGWVHSGSYSVRAIDMLATTNSCNGLSLVGRVDDYQYRVFIDAESSTILINLVRDDPRLNDQGHGDCRVLDEENYEVDVLEIFDTDTDIDE